MLILTNYQRFPETWTSATGIAGKTRRLKSFAEFKQHLRDADLIIVNCDVDLTLRLSALFLTCPWLKRPLVAVDLVLRKPKTTKSEWATRVKRLIMSQVSLFINYFRDLKGYERYYGISPARSSYVPFKPNIRYRYEVGANPDGRYILCFGRSLRDYDTFLKAMAMLPYPAAIPKPDFEQLRRHESRFSIPLSELPANVELLEDDGTDQAMLASFQNAKLIVLPILKDSICASGIGTYLNAMLMKKCVILSEGPGGSDVLRDQAILCPPEDSTALAEVIRRAWEDNDLRQRTAEAGYEYVLTLGGEPELYNRVLEASLRAVKP